MKRREFLKHVTRTTAALSATAFSPRRMASANERVRVALIGCGGRGTHVAKLMAQVPGVQLVAACDVYDSNAEKACQWMSPEARLRLASGTCPTPIRLGDWTGISIWDRHRTCLLTRTASCAITGGFGITRVDGLPTSVLIGSIPSNRSWVWKPP
jgi:hypothetical protein